MAVYLDHNATTPLDPRARHAVERWLADKCGNPAARDHRWGWDAAEELEDARQAVADAVDEPPQQVVFVSGATEALNTVLRAYVGLKNWAAKRIVTCSTEHDAVLAPSRYLSQQTGVGLSVLPVDQSGHLDMGELSRAVETSPGALVALMAANNETGTIHPIRQIADIAHAAGCVYLCDTTQAFGKLPIDLSSVGIDFATLSSHKIHGPNGIGALLMRQGQEDEFEPLLLGGEQEHGRRGGTVNLPSVAGFGEACRLLKLHLTAEIQRVGLLRDRLEDGILSQVSEAWVNGDRAHRLCNTTNLGFKGIEARTLIRDIHDVAVSTRSACASGHSRPSHVLKAIGLSDEDAYSCIRFSLGRFTTEEEIDYAISQVVRSTHKLRRSKRS